MLRIATIDNLSAQAYQLKTPDFPCSLTAQSPSAVYTMAQREGCAAALLPVARIRELAPIYAPLGHYGIACRGAVFSVMLFSESPLEEVLKARQPIFVTQASQTSRQLLYHLCVERYGYAPVWTEEEEESKTRLLIGNDAVNGDRIEQQWPVQVDLGAWWLASTGKPFVYAQWVVQKKLDETVKTQLSTWLEKTVSYSETAEGVKAMVNASCALGLDVAMATEYYAKVSARIHEEDEQGLACFFEMQEAGLCRNIA